ncbi:CsbD family protein [Acetobacterium bakii]|uniref:General stress protein CsbD n=1 Tax=Acetobacterium bakii TaxID=52689 RepID=A0A0L6TYP6_9FIRM|nr:hypothetical protein [Acetobacterium bakii]KNZ41217.1 hypothetical protein AKG39_12900 [Acetobacterium bakii]
MQTDDFESKWEQIKKEVQIKYGNVSDDDIDNIKGDTTKFESILQERCGISKEEAEKILKEHNWNIKD